MYKILGADQKEYGPVSGDQIRQWIIENRLNSQSRAQAEGSSEWRPLSAFPEFSTFLTQQTAGLPPHSAAVPIAVSGGTNRFAIIGLVLGIISVTCGLCCCGFAFSLPGIICSGLALTEIRKNPGQKGKGLAVAGLVLSVVGLIGGIIVSVAFGLLSSSQEIVRGFNR